MNILRIRLDEIDVGERLRAVDEDYAALLAENIAEQGQRTPIEVRLLPKGSAKTYALVAGAHRVHALRLAGEAEAVAVLFEGPEIAARLREIDENLIRHELTQLDRSTFLAERKTIYEAMYPEARQGGATKAKSFASFADDVAEKMGVSARLVQLAVQRHNAIRPDVRARIVGTWLSDHGAQLDQLAKAPGAEQLRAVMLMFGPIAEGFVRPTSVREALAMVRGEAEQPLDPAEARFDAFMRVWRKMPANERRRVAELCAAWAENRP